MSMYHEGHRELQDRYHGREVHYVVEALAHFETLGKYRSIGEPVFVLRQDVLHDVLQRRLQFDHTPRCDNVVQRRFVADLQPQNVQSLSSGHADLVQAVDHIAGGHAFAAVAEGVSS